MNKSFPEELPIDVEHLEVGDRVVYRRTHRTDNPYIITTVANISPKQKVITTVDNMRFSRDGWGYEEKTKYSYRLLWSTPELVEYVRRNALLGYVYGIDWSAQPTKTLEVVVAAYKSSMGLLE